MKIKIRKGISSIKGVDGMPVFYVDSPEKAERVARMLQDATKVGVDVESFGHDIKKEHPYGKAKLISYQFSCFGSKLESVHESKQIFVPHWAQHKYLRHFRPFLEDPAQTKVLHNAKYDMHVLANHGIEMQGLKGDTLIKAYLFNTAEDHGLKYLVRKHLGIEAALDYGDVFKVPKLKKNGEPGKQTILPSLDAVVRGEYAYANKGINELASYAVKDPYFTCLLDDWVDSKLSNVEWYRGKSMLDYYLMFDLDYTQVLFDMERRGVALDVEALHVMRSKMQDRLVEVEKLFFKTCVKMGIPSRELESFNIGSPKQLGSLLTERLGVELPTTPSGQPSTADGALSSLRSPKAKAIVSIVLEHRGLKKLLGTYADPFIEMAEDPRLGGRLRTSFSQIGTITMRLSCVAGWTPIRTPSGDKQISSVVPGDYVWTHKKRWRKVLASFTKGYDGMYDVHLSNGSVLTCTLKHKVLASNGAWVSLGEILDVDNTELGEQQKEHKDCSFSLQVEEDHTDCEGSVRGDGDIARQRFLHPEQAHAYEREKSAGSGALLEIENRKQESDEGEVSGSTPQLEGSLRGWLRIPDMLARRETPLCPSRGDGAGDRMPSSSTPGCSPHRQQQEEQFDRQFSRSDEQRAQGYPLLSVGFDHVEIEKVVYRGCCEVYDITVDEDESYEACGIFSHNSRSPNLQNIPRFGEDESDRFGIRTAFVPDDDDHVFGDADMSQIEIRLMAHLSKDPVLIEALRKGWDIHARTAYTCFSEIKSHFGSRQLDTALLKEIKEKFPTQRQRSKTLNFMLSYGGGPGRYADLTGSTLNEGRKVVRAFFRDYNGLKRHIDQVRKSCYAKGYVRTLLGRYIHIPDIRSLDDGIRSAAERQAFNYRIQSSCADILKMAMLLIHRDDRLRYDYGVDMSLQIHDEITFNVPKEHKEKVKPIIDDYMSEPYKHFGLKSLIIPTPAELGYGSNWQEAKEAG